MNPTPNNTKLIVTIVIVVIAVIAIIAIRSTSKTGGEAAGPSLATSTAPTVSTSTSTPTMATSTPDLTMTTDTFAYAVSVPKSSYGQNEQIPIGIAVLNLSKVPQTLTFKNGCQGDYTIGGFDMVAHTTCLPGPTSFTIAPGEIKKVILAHYPSVYKIPVGTYSLYASIVGYGGKSIPLTITP